MSINTPYKKNSDSIEQNRFWWSLDNMFLLDIKTFHLWYINKDNIIRTRPDKEDYIKLFLTKEDLISEKKMDSSQ